MNSSFLLAQGSSIELYAIAKKMMEQRSYDDALEYLDKAISIETNNARYYMEKGKCHYLLSQLDMAIFSYEKAAMYQPKDPEIFAGLGKLYIKWNNLGKAIENFEKAYSLEESKEKKYEHKLLIIKYLYASRDYTTVQAHLNEALKVFPDEHELLYYVGMEQNRLKKYPNAEIYLQKAVAKVGTASPNETAGYFYQLGYSYYMQEKYDQASYAFSHAEHGSYKQKVIRYKPEYKYYLATAYYQIFDLNKAELLAKETLKISSSFQEANTILTKISQSRTDKRNLMTAIQERIRLEHEPNRLCTMFMELAQYQYENKLFLEAIETIEKALKLRPSLQDLMFLKAICLQELNHPSESLNLLTQLSSLGGIDAESKSRFAFAAGQLCLKDNKDKLAESFFLKCTSGPFKYAAMEELRSLLKSDD